MTYETHDSPYCLLHFAEIRLQKIKYLLKRRHNTVAIER